MTIGAKMYFSIAIIRYHLILMSTLYVEHLHVWVPRLHLQHWKQKRRMLETESVDEVVEKNFLCFLWQCKVV